MMHLVLLTVYPRHFKPVPCNTKTFQIKNFMQKENMPMTLSIILRKKKFNLEQEHKPYEKKAPGLFRVQCIPAR